MKLRRVSLVAGLIVAVGASAFTVIYATRGSDAVTQAQAPIDRPAKDVTPPPGATPDTSKPFWHIPYINQDEKRPTFVGARYTSCAVRRSRSMPTAVKSDWLLPSPHRPPAARLARTNSMLGLVGTP